MFGIFLCLFKSRDARFVSWCNQKKLTSILSFRNHFPVPGHIQYLTSNKFMGHIYIYIYIFMCVCVCECACTGLRVTWYTWYTHPYIYKYEKWYVIQIRQNKILNRCIHFNNFGSNKTFSKSSIARIAFKKSTQQVTIWRACEKPLYPKFTIIFIYDFLVRWSTCVSLQLQLL